MLLVISVNTAERESIQIEGDRSRSSQRFQCFPCADYRQPNEPERS